MTDPGRPRIVFMGTPDFAVPSLEACTKLGDVVLVVTQPDKPKGRGRELSAPPFYSAAAIPRGNYLLWVFAGLDGRLHLLDGFTHQVLPARWGSNLAAVHAACRPEWQLLADASDTEKDVADLESDSVQAFEFPGRAPVAVSAKLKLNGRVTALEPGPEAGSGLAIYRNSLTGNYEALDLNLDCTP